MKRDNKTPRILEVITQTKEQNISNQRDNNDYKQTNNDFFKHILGTITEESQPEKENQGDEGNKKKEVVVHNEEKTKHETQKDNDKNVKDNVKNKNVKNGNVNVKNAGKGSKKQLGGQKSNKQLVGSKSLEGLQKNRNNTKGRPGNTTIKKGKSGNETRESATADYLKSVINGGGLQNVLNEMRKTVLEKKHEEEQKKLQEEQDRIKHLKWLVELHNQLARRRKENEEKKEQRKQRERLKQTNSTNTMEVREANEANEGEQTMIENNANQVLNHNQQDASQLFVTNEVNNQAIEQGRPVSSVSEIDDGMPFRPFYNTQHGFFYTTTMQPELFNTISNQTGTIEWAQKGDDQHIRWYRICTKLPRKQRVSQTNPFKYSDSEVKEGLKKMLQRVNQWGNERKKLEALRRLYGGKDGEKKYYDEKLRINYNKGRKKIRGANGTVLKKPVRSQRQFNGWRI